MIFTQFEIIRIERIHQYNYYRIMLEYTLIKLPTSLQIGHAPPKMAKQFLHEDKCPHFLFKNCADLLRHILQSLID